MRAKAEELAKRPYMVMTSLDITTEGHPIYFARVLEIEGCFGQGETREKAIEDLKLAMVDLFESLLEDGLSVPEPTPLIRTTSRTEAASAINITMLGDQRSMRLTPKPKELGIDAYLLAPRAN